MNVVVELDCEGCSEVVEVALSQTVMHVTLTGPTNGALLYCCPDCGHLGVARLTEGAVIGLTRRGAYPLFVPTPSLDPGDRPPPGPEFTRDDLLDWHASLNLVDSVEPWE
jgi:hypothetical protein